MRVAFATKALLLLTLGTLLAVPSAAWGVLSGPNGRIVYISGRGYTDAEAKPYLRVAAGSIGFGLNAGPMSMATGQHRHPTWSPDRTKIAYARSGPGCSPDCDIYVLDLTTPFPVAQNFTNTPNVNEDRPAWSPDGTRIAYESEVSDGSGQLDILVDPVEAGATVNLTSTPGTIEGKPAWTPDSQTVYYAFNNNADIYREPADNSQALGTPVLNSGTGEFQPSISPDGTQMCYTRGAFDNTADVYVVNSDGSNAPGNDLSDNPGVGDFNCTWSPTGFQIAYVRGIFSEGDLYIEDADDNSFPLLVEGVPGAFDGNPDWAPDGRPACESVDVSTDFGEPVTIPLECLDTGPFYERTPVQEFAPSETDNGTLSDIVLGDQDPSTVVYTPNDGFSGADTFEYGGFDLIAGFADPAGNVTINVAEEDEAEGPPPDPPPVMSNLRVVPRNWRLGPRAPRLLAAQRGARILWRLSEDAATVLVFQRALPGRRVGRRCVKPLRRFRNRRPCRRFRRSGSLTLPAAKAGLNDLRFQGRLAGRRRLRPGRYRAVARATDPAGQRSELRVSPIFRALPPR